MPALLARVGLEVTVPTWGRVERGGGRRSVLALPRDVVTKGVRASGRTGDGCAKRFSLARDIIGELLG